MFERKIIYRFKPDLNLSVASRDLNLDYVATVNPGCTRQLVKELKQAGIKTKVMHIAELGSMAKP